MGASVLTEDRVMYLTRAERALGEVLFMTLSTPSPTR
jgi:hypothetical protein